MRKSRVIGFAIVSLLTVGSLAGAQTAAPGAPQARQQRGGRVEGGRGRLLRGIELSDAEKARVKEIRGKYRTEAQSLQQSLEDFGPRHDSRTITKLRNCVQPIRA